MSNVVCLKHSQYRGETAPDLSCKMCCSMFVARIRAGQAAKLEDQRVESQTPTSSFKPLLVGEPAAAKPAAAPKPSFDASWV